MKGLFILFRGKKQSISFPLYFYKILTEKNGKKCAAQDFTKARERFRAFCHGV